MRRVAARTLLFRDMYIDMTASVTRGWDNQEKEREREYVCVCVCSVLHEFLQVFHIIVFRHLDIVVLRLAVDTPPSPPHLARHLDAEKREFIVARISHLFQQPTASQRRAQSVAIRAARVPGVAISVHRAIPKLVRAMPRDFLGPKTRGMKSNDQS